MMFQMILLLYFAVTVFCFDPNDHNPSSESNSFLKLNETSTDSFIDILTGKHFEHETQWGPAGNLQFDSLASTAPPTESPAEQPSKVSTHVPTVMPSVVPVPLFMPSCVPSAGPTANPSAAPSIVPSAMPLFLPSSGPSQTPSATPSTAPPTFTLSSAPSSQPSSSPSNHSSSPSTQVPSVSPSFVPTRHPSLTASPTAAGTAQSLQYNVSQALNGISAATYRANLATNNAAFKAATIVFLPGLTTDNILIKTITDIIISRRRTRRLSLHTESTSACAIGYTISVANTAALGYSSAAAAYNSTTHALTAAVSSGQFSTQLQTQATTLGASTLTSVTAANITVTTATIEPVTSTNNNNNNSENKKVKLTTGAIIGIVIGSVVAAAAVIFFIYYFLNIRRAKVLYRPPRSPRRPPSTGSTRAAGQRPQVDENGVVIQEVDQGGGVQMLGAASTISAAQDLEEARDEERTTHIVLW